MCVKMTVTHEFPRWWVSAQHHRQQRHPHPDAIGRRRLLVKHSTLPHHSDQRFLFSLPCPPPGTSPAFLFSPVPPPPRLHTPMLSSSISQHSIYCCSIHLGWSPGSSPPRPRLVDSLWVSWRTTFHYQSDMAQPRTPLLLSSLGHDGPEPDRHL